jgi:hypothetical protein
MAFAAACSSGQPSTSPGTVTLRLLLPQGQQFCDIINNCSGPTHFFVGKESGNWLPFNPGPCGGGVPCHTCMPLPCAAGACDPGPISLPVTNVESTWDGSYVDWSTCGSGARCYSPRFVAPGRYVARLCATPGVTDADGITCMQTGPEECVETTFDLPGPTLVEVPLR